MTRSAHCFEVRLNIVIQRPARPARRPLLGRGPSRLPPQAEKGVRKSEQESVLCSTTNATHSATVTPARVTGRVLAQANSEPGPLAPTQYHGVAATAVTVTSHGAQSRRSGPGPAASESRVSLRLTDSSRAGTQAQAGHTLPAAESPGGTACQCHRDRDRDSGSDGPP